MLYRSSWFPEFQNELVGLPLNRGIERSGGAISAGSRVFPHTIGGFADRCSGRNVLT
jgi:hypothetical protein